MNSKTVALIALFTVQLLYGFNYTIAKQLMNTGGVSPDALVVFRVAGAAILFWLFGLFYKGEKIERKDFLTLFFAALFGVGINMILYLKGLELTTPIHASVISTIIPILILVLSAFFLNEKLTKLKILGVILGFAGGVLLTILGKSTRTADNVLLGNIFVFLNALFYSGYVILVKKLTAKYHPFSFIKWLFLIGIFIVVPFGYQDTLTIDYHAFDGYAWFLISFVVLGATFGTYFLNPLALRSLKASTVGIFVYLQPVIAGIFALATGKDSINIIKILAMFLIFFGVYLVTKKPKIASTPNPNL
ncbi:MAG: DMT family transporter [Bacteroidota bacterium]